VRRRPPATSVLGTAVGSVALPNPVMTASGTAGHSTELAAYLDLGRLGAMVVKSLSAEPWPGNPPLRVQPTAAGMLNSVGLQGPGIPAWRDHELPALAATGARIVVSIWGRSVEDYGAAARLVADLGAEVVAVEVNLSCPNLHGANAIFAHSPVTTAEVLAVVGDVGRPVWAKLSPNVTDIVAIAEAAYAGGAEAVTLVNTLLGMAIDVTTRRPVLGTRAGGPGSGGGLSGPAIHPVAVRAVYEVRRALGDVPIVGVGGVASGADAVELMLAGASAVQVGTATFADPRAPERVLDQLAIWCRRNGVHSVSELIGAAHR
jgi:dihydroorotate dehydrogenase (NAD+) catalytic subunit